MRGVFYTIAFTAISLSVAFSQEARPRSLFMSTAQSKVIYKQPEEPGKPKQNSVTKKPTKPTEQEKINEVYYGMRVQIYAEKNGKPIPVNPKTYYFKTGDRFKVKIEYNTPGIVEFINIDPKGKTTYLGSWVVEHAFTGTMLPADGYFKFVGTKGTEKLIVRFFPCNPTDKNKIREINTASSRSIAFVKEEDVQPAEVNLNLPACNFENMDSKVAGIPKTVNAVSSREIVFIQEEKRLYYMISQEDYNKNKEPIYAVLELKHR